MGLTISHQMAVQHANNEYEIFHTETLHAEAVQADQKDFEQLAEQFNTQKKT